MRLVVFGATGLLGQAIVSAAQARGYTVIGAARRGAERAIDLANSSAIAELIAEVSPDLVVNAAAISRLDECESNPAAAYLVNARAVSIIAECCRSPIRLVQVSTDHYFTGEGRKRHDECAPVRAVNEYARTKLAAETFALTAPNAMVVRTNIAGFRGWPQPTFLEWAIDALRRRAPMSLFEDYFTSTIDAGSLARAILDLTVRKATGLFNVGSSEVASKREFVTALAEAMSIELDWATAGSVKNLAIPRAESLGLDVSRAEAILGYRMPDLKTIVASLIAEEKRA